MAEEEVKVHHDTYKCPNCGASMHYDPESRSLKCDYCEHVIKLQDEKSSEELDFNSAEKENDLSWQQENHVFKCQECGAETVVKKTEMSIKCPFCGSNQVLESEELSGIKPNRVIPFNINDEKAKNQYQAFLKKKLFVPSKVKKMTIDCIPQGTYIPSWTYDTDTFSTYKGRLGEYYYVTVGSGKDKRTERRTRYFSIQGTNTTFFDDILINSGTAISGKELSKLEPYNTNNSNVFSESFLAGFSAEHYHLTVQNGFNQAKEKMAPVIRSNILKKYTYDVVDYLNVSTSYNDITYKYVLLPVYIGNFNYREKKYRFLVNGETGKTTGKYPLSPLRITIFSTIMLIILAAIIIIVYFVYFK